jgi:hypothetical protein
VGAAAAGVGVFATFFGGGPAVAAAFAGMCGRYVSVGGGGGGGGAKSPTLTPGGSIKGERVKLLSPQQAAGRLTSTFAAP